MFLDGEQRAEPNVLRINDRPVGKERCPVPTVFAQVNAAAGINEPHELGAVQAGCVLEVVFAVEEHVAYMRDMIDTTDFKEIQMIRLFRSVLEECFEIICGLSDTPIDLWEWAKSYLLMMDKKQKFGNLYEKSIAAAKCCGDEIAEALEPKFKGCSLWAEMIP